MNGLPGAVQSRDPARPQARNPVRVIKNEASSKMVLRFFNAELWQQNVGNGLDRSESEEHLSYPGKALPSRQKKIPGETSGDLKI